MDAKKLFIKTHDRKSFNPRARDGREAGRKLIGFLVAGFNPRARDGREPPSPTKHNLSLVSIHAPVMDAKITSSTSMTTIQRFNPRARDGREVVSIFMDNRLSGFNPRARDGRESTAFLSTPNLAFQSTRP